MKVLDLTSLVIIGSIPMNAVLAFAPLAKSAVSVKHHLHTHHSKTGRSENMFDETFGYVCTFL